VTQAGPARRPTIAEIVLSDRPELWRELGFEMRDDSFEVGSVTFRFLADPDRRGIVEWSLRDVITADLDGLPTRLTRSFPVAGGRHPNGAMAVDHVVVITPSLDRTAAALDDAGIGLRRVREAGSPRAPARQGFFRLGEVILEVVQQAAPEDGDQGATEVPSPGDPARFWGVVFVVSDLDQLGSVLGDRLGQPRDAVQPGRRIATLKSSAGVSLPVAFITPELARQS
jgi:hypothetical protein